MAEQNYRDAGLDYLLGLDGERMFVRDEGYWVKFEVRRVPVSDTKPHGLDYSLTLHDPRNKRILGFDNAHPVPPRKWTEPHDHRHVQRSVRPYEYTDAAALVVDFWTAVDKMLGELGV